MIKIWQRYFLKEIISTLFLFLAMFWGLYVVVDYTSRMSIFRAFEFTPWNVGQYYFYSFLKRLEILLPFAFLISAIRTITKLNMNNELVALMTSGIPLKTLMRPFLLFAITLSLLSYVNYEWGYPQALLSLHLLEDSHTSNEYKRDKNHDVQSLNLDDGSVILFNYLDSSTDTIENAFWVQSIDRIFHIKRLAPFAAMPRGEWVEIFQRDQQGEIHLVADHRKMEFPSLRLADPEKALQLHRPQEQPLSVLYKLIMEGKKIPGGKSNLILTSLISKLTLPWLPLLVFLAIAPSCLIFSRTPPAFFIYIAGMVGLVVFYLIFNAFATLSEHQVMSPWWSLALPFATLFLFFSWRY